jgi:IclR family transcriptional regulator, pca regulon regulatory protein
MALSIDSSLAKPICAEIAMRNSVSICETSGRRRSNPRYFVRALAQGLAVLEQFDAAGGALSLMEVSRGLGCTKATAFRHLATLVELGYLEVDAPTRRYRPSVRALRLGAAYLSALSLPELAAPVLERLSARLGESTNLAVLDGAEVVYVARVGSKRILSTNLRVGSRLPAYCTSMGKVLLAWLDEPRLRAALAATRFERVTPRTVTSAARLRPILRLVRQRGWAVNDQELDLGLRSCSAPVLDRGGAAVAALNVSASSAQASLEELEQRFVPAVVEAAREITQVVRSRL